MARRPMTESNAGQVCSRAALARVPVAGNLPGSDAGGRCKAIFIGEENEIEASLDPELVKDRGKVVSDCRHSN